jgi:hypothetical protein
MSIPVKSCLFCKYIEYEPGYAYSEVTFDDPIIFCNKLHFHTHLDEEKHLIKNLRELVIKAETCLDYIPCQ